MYILYVYIFIYSYIMFECSNMSCVFAHVPKHPFWTKHDGGGSTARPRVVTGGRGVVREEPCGASSRILVVFEQHPGDIRIPKTCGRGMIHTKIQYVITFSKYTKYIKYTNYELWSSDR